MKKLFFALMICGVLLVQSSCSKDDPNNDDPTPETALFRDDNFRAALVKMGFVEIDGNTPQTNETNKALFASTLKNLESGNQQPDKTLALTLTTSQNDSWKSLDTPKMS